MFVKPDSVLARTAREMLDAHAGGSGPRDGMTNCPQCGEPLPCGAGRAAAEVVAAAGLAQSSGLVAAARRGRGPDPDTRPGFGELQPPLLGVHSSLSSAGRPATATPPDPTPPELGGPGRGGSGRGGSGRDGSGLGGSGLGGSGLGGSGLGGPAVPGDGIGGAARGGPRADGSAPDGPEPERFGLVGADPGAGRAGGSDGGPTGSNVFGPDAAGGSDPGRTPSGRGVPHPLDDNPGKSGLGGSGVGGSGVGGPEPDADAQRTLPQPPTVGRSGRPPLEPPALANRLNGTAQAPARGTRPPLEPPAAAPRVGRPPLQPPQFVPQNRPLGAPGPSRPTADAAGAQHSDPAPAGQPVDAAGWSAPERPDDEPSSGLPPLPGGRAHSDDTGRFFDPGNGDPSTV